MKNLEMVIQFGIEGAMHFRVYINFKKEDNKYNFSYYDPAPESQNIRDIVKRQLFGQLSVTSDDVVKGLKDVCVQLQKMLLEISFHYNFFPYVSAEQLKYLCHTYDIISIKSS